ncbi:MAG: ribosome biogenesis GTPase Der [Verrucomicrobiales bacterium]|nr:ribosome biogenesis GTPase Der [Verrucomicrobiales bacterium]
MPRNHKPQVAIVGRPNVGKSAIFNTLAGRRIAIVHDQPGVTRDRIATECKDARIPYELTDTGGIGAVIDDGFAEQVRIEADIAIHTSDLILFVVDVREGVHPIDHELADVLRKGDAPVLLVVNKVDTTKSDNETAAFSKLGFENQVNVSAAHTRNFGELDEEIYGYLKHLEIEASEADEEEEDEEDPGVRIAIVGRPNVGKSSLINAILNDERSIVSNVAGTTRDAVDVPYTRDAKKYTLIDTAGIRKRGNRDTSVEVFSVMRSEKSIRRADICLLVIDASSGVVSQDRRIAKMVIEANRPCIVLLNKFDLFHPDAKYQDRIEQFKEELGDDLFFLPYAPKVAISAKNRQYLGKIFNAVQDVLKAAAAPIPTGLLNRLLQQAIERNPPPVRHSKRLKLLYATQRREDKPATVPVPEYLLFVNHANLLTRTYERFLENQIRKQYPMEGLPFVFRVRSRVNTREDGKGKNRIKSGEKGKSETGTTPRAKGGSKKRPNSRSSRGSGKPAETRGRRDGSRESRGPRRSK